MVAVRRDVGFPWCFSAEPGTRTTPLTPHLYVQRLQSSGILPNQACQSAAGTEEELPISEVGNVENEITQVWSSDTGFAGAVWILWRNRMSS